ncbi:MAG TPA: hypothetical protein VEK34_10205 [Methylocella sp.]|nr:hypothetical protein [Methylocella sp.]
MEPAASALTGQITDPRTLGIDYPRIAEPAGLFPRRAMFAAPLDPAEAAKVPLVKGPNIKTLPRFEALPQRAVLPILIKAGDDVSTDEIMPAGAEVLPYRSNIEKISEFVFRPIDTGYAKRAANARESGHAILGGANYGQGSSREHAAIAPWFLGVRAVLAKSYARIHKQNLINYGIVPFELANPAEYDQLSIGDCIVIEGWLDAVERSGSVEVELQPGQGEPRPLALKVSLSKHDREILLAGGAINLWRTAVKLAAAHQAA